MKIISYESNILDIDIKRFKREHRQVGIPDEESYRNGVLSDLLSLRSQYSYFEESEFDISEINIMINDVCVS